jgi:uncharacterized protein YjiS (DUF1127 family)
MTCTPLSPAMTRKPATLQARVSALATAAWRAYLERRARQTTVRLLRSLDERTLQDIGVSPTEIESLVYGRPGERKRCYDRMWWARLGPGV